MITRPALRYHGGKWTLASWIISHFPSHEHYVEPYGGGASVLISKPPSKIETYNDLDSRVVEFFRVLRERPKDLIHTIELTPWSREELLISREPLDESHSDPCLERARRFFVAAWMGRGKATATMSTGWRYEISAIRGTRAYKDFRDLERLEAIAGRLLNVQIDNDDALSVIDRFDTPDTLFYLDPPYVQSSRSERWGKKAYSYEMSDNDHEQLLVKLLSIEGMAVLSGYPNEMYDSYLQEWTCVTKEVTTDGRGDTLPKRTECLWKNPYAMRRQPQLEMEFEEVR